MTAQLPTRGPLDVLRIHPDDNVCVAVRPLAAGTVVSCAGVSFLLAHDVRLGAKLALRPLRTGEKVFKYGEPIGSLTAEVPLGGYVHTHNLDSDYLHTYERGELLAPAPARPNEPAVLRPIEAASPRPNEPAVPRPTYRPPR